MKQLRTCGTQCPHFDEINECCWLSWRRVWFGDPCHMGQYDDDGEPEFMLSWDQEAAKG